MKVDILSGKLRYKDVLAKAKKDLEVSLKQEKKSSKKKKEKEVKSDERKSEPEASKDEKSTKKADKIVKKDAPKSVTVNKKPVEQPKVVKQTISNGLQFIYRDVVIDARLAEIAYDADSNHVVWITPEEYKTFLSYPEIRTACVTYSPNSQYSYIIDNELCDDDVANVLGFTTKVLWNKRMEEEGPTWDYYFIPDKLQVFEVNVTFEDLKELYDDTIS